MFESGAEFFSGFNSATALLSFHVHSECSTLAIQGFFYKQRRELSEDWIFTGIFGTCIDKDRQGVEVGYRYTKQAKSQEQYLVSIRVLFFTISSFKVARVAVVFASKS